MYVAKRSGDKVSWKLSCHCKQHAVTARIVLKQNHKGCIPYQYPLSRKVGRLKQSVCDMQEYITEMGQCLMSTGQDMDSTPGRRLQ